MTISAQPALHLYESGDPAAAAILFLHGSPLSGRMWQPQLETLSEFHCLAPDLPGHGMSAKTGAVSMDALVQALAELIRERCASGKAHVVGHSYGGVVAQALISGAPEVVKSALLSGTSARLSPFMSGVFKVYLKLNEPILRLLRPEQLGKLLALQFGIPAQFIQSLGEDMKRMEPARMARVLTQSYLDIHTPRDTSIPVLVAAGSRETPFARGMARSLVRKIPASKGVLIPGLGHVWNLQDPQLFAEVVRTWTINRKIPGSLLPHQIT